MTQTDANHGWPERAPPGRIAYVNGRYVAHAQAGVHIEDRGLQFADAIYEVFGVIAGRIYDEEEHLDRLERSLGELAMTMPMRREPLKLVVREIARRNRVTDGLIYLQITRGAFREGPCDSRWRSHQNPVSFSRRVTWTWLRWRSRRETGIKIVTGPDERWGRCDIKSTSLLANVLAKTSARQAGAYETWLIDRDGYVTEGSSTSAWIVDSDGRLITRDLSHAILPGVTRRIILEVAAEAQTPVVERRFTPAEAIGAKEAFITAATIGALPVTTIDGRTIGEGKPGPIARRLQELYGRESAARAST